MPVTYTCPNPDCRATLSTANPPPAGKRVKCPKCGLPFVPEPEDKPAAGAGTFAFKDDPKPAGKPAKAAESGAKPPPAPAAAKAARPLADDDEDPESVKKGYGVVQETAAEKEAAERNKPTFGSMETKHRRSARGPATAMLVMPANLLVFEGIVTCVGGLVLFVFGMWPLVFNDASPGDEEVEEAIVTMILGVMTFGWGAMICYGASQMQELASYLWAMTGAVMGILPLLVGIFAVIALQNPKVKAGFEEVEGALDEDEDGGPDDDEDEDDGDEDDDQDDGRRRRK
ncbi:MAG: hypothetical protein K2X82_23635 [Gemmataceae bacterium]|nr:hypothetical protein [Gemmataceae bacterium]